VFYGIPFGTKTLSLSGPKAGPTFCIRQPLLSPADGASYLSFLGASGAIDLSALAPQLKEFPEVVPSAGQFHSALPLPGETAHSFSMGEWSVPIMITIVIMRTNYDNTNDGEDNTHQMLVFYINH
jgi:hypothetical protein